MTAAAAAAQGRSRPALRLVLRRPLRVVDVALFYGERSGGIRRMLPYETDRDALASAYRSARCGVMPGAFETFGLVAFEAAASGAATVACETAPSARLLGSLVHTFRPGDPHALLAAIEGARAAEPERLVAARFAAANRWERAFAAELADLETLVAAR